MRGCRPKSFEGNGWRPSEDRLVRDSYGVVLEDALHHRCEHFNDDLGTRTVAAVLKGNTQANVNEPFVIVLNRTRLKKSQISGEG